MQDFAGAPGLLVVNSLMRKWALLVGFVGIASIVAAEQAPSFEPTVTFEQLSLYRPGFIDLSDSASLLQNLQLPNAMDDQDLPAAAQFAWIGIAPADVFPVLYVTPRKNTAAKSKRNVADSGGKDAKDGADDLSLTPVKSYYVGGEVGFMYGHSSGKFGGDEFSSYITGGIGNDHFHINVGASQQEFSGRVPRWIR